jgi:hypothetical protein
MISQLWSRCDDRQNAAPPLNETIRPRRKQEGSSTVISTAVTVGRTCRVVQALEYTIVGIKQSIFSNLIAPLRQHDLCWGVVVKNSASVNYVTHLDRCRELFCRAWADGLSIRGMSVNTNYNRHINGR